MKTIRKQVRARYLRKGDVIVYPDGTRHEVTFVDNVTHVFVKVLRVPFTVCPANCYRVERQEKP